MLFETTMNENISKLITECVERMPDWIRRDLGSKDKAAKEAAEETLARLISDAISTAG